MDTEIKVIPFHRKTSFISMMIISGLFMIYYLVMSMMAPVKKLHEITVKYGFLQNENNPVNEKILSDSTYLALLKKKSYCQSGVTMAATDSIYMTINLADSIVNLEISGVVVHTAEIKRKKISRILERDEYPVLNMISSPFDIAMDYSSIKKEPLMIKMAPKDTSEYEPDIIPDTADYEPVNFILVTGNGVKIYIYQNEKLKFGDSLCRFGFDLLDRLRTTCASLVRILTFRIPEYQPYIRLRLARADAKRVYRALPYHGQVGIYR